MISEKLKTVILGQLGLEQWNLTDESTAGEVPGWDSLTHAALIAAVEDAFGVRFSTREIVQLANVGQLQALIDTKTR